MLCITLIAALLTVSAKLKRPEPISEATPMLQFKKLNIFEQQYCETSFDCCNRAFIKWRGRVKAWADENGVTYVTPVQAAFFSILSEDADLGSFICVDGRDWEGQDYQVRSLNSDLFTEVFYLRADKDHQLELYTSTENPDFAWAVKGKVVPRTLPLDQERAAIKTEKLNVRELELAIMKQTTDSFNKAIDKVRAVREASEMVTAFLADATRLYSQYPPGAGSSSRP